MSGLNLHLYPSSLLHEVRLEKICRSISGLGVFSRVEMIGVHQEKLAAIEDRGGVTLRRLPRRHWGGPGALRKIVQTLDWSRRVLGTFRREDVRCVNSHSLAVLPLGVFLKLRHGARLVYDTHEFETEVTSARGPVRWLYKTLEWTFIRWADEVVVVSDSIADWYAQNYGIARPVVVRNVPEVPAAGLPSADPALWRKRFKIPANHLIFIYQGGLFPGRRIEQLIRVFAQAKPDRHVVFMGYGELEGVVQAAAARHANIHFAPAVAPADVLRHTAGADVGLVGVANICLSYYYSLPNKLFEFLLAGLPAIMPAFPEMVRTAEATGCGWTVGEDDADWLEAVNSLDWSAVNLAQIRAREAAAGFSWAREEQKLKPLYQPATPSRAA
jgi:glycosyltransferase involved in cell wall biosynthesis